MERRHVRCGIARTATIAVAGLVAAGMLSVAACTAGQDGRNGESAQGGVESSSSERILDQAHWADIYPNEYDSYIDAGYAHYTQPDETGKVNTFWTATHTDVATPATGCLRCHTSEFSTLVDTYGDALFTTDYETVRRDVRSGVGCYSCHGNDPEHLEVANAWIVDAAAQGGIETSTDNLVCAQCHSLPDFSNLLDNPDQTTWSTLKVGVDPEAVWDYFVSEGYDVPQVDSTVVEFNNYYGSTMFEAGAKCSDCHMAKMTDEKGATYTQHQFQGVGNNEAIYDNCLNCHKDSTVEERKKAVAQVQEDYAVRRAPVQALVDELTAKVTAAQTSGTMSAGELAKATALMNEATFYLSYATDPSNGFHAMGHSATAGCFDKATAVAQEGLSLFVS